MRLGKWTGSKLIAIFMLFPLLSYAATPINSIVIFGDSYSDIGNTTHLLKSLRQEEAPAFVVSPFKRFVINKMNDFANDYYVPQMVLDAGLNIVNNFFDYELAPYLVDLVNKVKRVPLLPGRPYWRARFSNGPVWNEYLAQMLSLQTNYEEVYLNMAFGGSWAATYDYQLSVWNVIRHPLGIIKTLIVGKLIPPSLGLTMQAYLMSQQKTNEQSLYFIFAGSNDYLNFLLFKDNYNSSTMSKYVANVVGSIQSSVLKLIQSGAKRLVVMGIPPLGETPKFINTTDREVINLAVEQHNTLLATRVEEWKKLYPGVDFVFIDTAQIINKIISNQRSNGFANVQQACIDVQFPMFNALNRTVFANNPVLLYTQIVQYQDQSFGENEYNYSVCTSPQQYFFWDEIHWSTRAHQYLAFEVCTALKEHGYQANCALY